jgi:hypothetical protein
LVYNGGVNRHLITNPAMSPVAAIAALLCAALTGCGGPPPPNDQLAASQAALRAAIEVGGTQEPQAALHLKLAREQMDKAKALIEEGDNETAQRVLQRAEADAELARALAKKSTTQAAADEATSKITKLKGGPK